MFDFKGEQSLSYSSGSAPVMIAHSLYSLDPVRSSIFCIFPLISSVWFKLIKNSPLSIKFVCFFSNLLLTTFLYTFLVHQYVIGSPLQKHQPDDSTYHMPTKPLKKQIKNNYVSRNYDMQVAFLGIFINFTWYFNCVMIVPSVKGCKYHSKNFN